MKALAGLRVLDFTWVLAGPYATRILADFGAEVIKVGLKYLPGSTEDNLTGYFSTWNRSKLSISLNLAKPKGRDIARRLVGLSDVVVENFSPRVMANWGLGYEHLKRVRPDLIMLSLSGMGQTGGWRNHIAFDATIQALSGLTNLTTFPGRQPLGVGCAHGDHVAGLAAALAALEALEYRDQTGEGQCIDISELEALTSLLGGAVLEFTASGQEATPEGNGNPDFAPSGVYRCRGDDRWCAISVSSEEEWQRFCEVMGYPGWTKEAGFASTSSRLEHSAELDRLVEGWTTKHTPEEVMSRLQGAGVASGVVSSAADLARDPQLQERGFFTEVEHPVLGRVTFDTTPIKLSETPAGSCRPAHLLGQDNDYVYGELLRMSQEEIARLTEEGVF